MTAASTPDTAWLESRAPLSDELLGRFAISSEEDIADTVDRARIAARWWGDLTWAERRKRLLLAKRHLAR